MARTSVFLVAAVCLLFTSGGVSAAGSRILTQSNQSTAGCTSIYGVLTTPGLETLGQLVSSVGLSGVTSNQSLPYTVFAPSNQAFKNLLSALNTTSITSVLPISELRDIILYHILPERYTTDEIHNIAGKQLSTLLPGQNVTIDVEGSSLLVIGYSSDATVTVPDVVTGCGKGVVHIVDNVLIPDLAAVTSNVATASVST